LPQQETQTAIVLVNANKTLNTTSTTSEANKPLEHVFQVQPGPRHHRRTGSSGSAGSGSSFISRTASPAKFDKYGRRILTPPNTRSNSAYGSIPGTPRRETEVSTVTLFAPPNCTLSPTNYVLKYACWRDQQIEDDVDRANSLMALYEIRAKLKDQDNRALNKLREKIDALHARQQAEKKDGDMGRMRLSYPKGS
jgi:hypothetical protein